MASQTASKATLYGLLFPKPPISPQKHQARPTFYFFPGPREAPSLAVLCPPSLSDRRRLKFGILLHRNKQYSETPFVFPVGVAKPFARKLSLQSSPCRQGFTRHRPPSALPPSACFRDRRSPDPAYRSRVPNFAFYRFARTAGISATPEPVGIRHAQAKLRGREHRRRYVPSGASWPYNPASQVCVRPLSRGLLWMFKPEKPC